MKLTKILIYCIGLCDLVLYDDASSISGNPGNVDVHENENGVVDLWTISAMCSITYQLKSSHSTDCSYCDGWTIFGFCTSWVTRKCSKTRQEIRSTEIVCDTCNLTNDAGQFQLSSFTVQKQACSSPTCRPNCSSPGCTNAGTVYTGTVLCYRSSYSEPIHTNGAVSVNFTMTSIQNVPNALYSPACEDREFNISVNPPVVRSIPIVLRCKSVKKGDNPCITTSRIDAFSLSFVKSNDGEIIMLLKYLLYQPYENKNTYTSTLNVGCGDNNTIATITIHVMDLNDAPILGNMHHTLLEGLVGQWRIPLIDPDVAMPYPSGNKAWKELTIESFGMPRQFQITKQNQSNFLLKLINPLYAKDPRWISDQRGTTTNCTLHTEHKSLADIYGQFLSPKIDFTLIVKDGGGLAANASVTIEISEANNLPFCDPVLLRNESRKMPQLLQCKPIVDLFICCHNPDLCTGCKLDFTYLGDRECQQVFQVYSNFHEHVVQLAPCPEHLHSNKTICTVALQDRYNDSLSPVMFEVKLSECPEEIDQYNVKWEKGLPGQYMQRNCSSGFSGSVLRLCGTDGVHRPAFYNCTSTQLGNLAKQAGYKNFNVSKILDELSSATITNATYQQPLLAGDMETVTSIMTTVTERIKTEGHVNTEQVNNFLESASNVMEEWNNNTWKSIVEKTGIGVDRVLNNIDSFIQVALTINRSTDLEESYSKSNLYLRIGRIRNFQYDLTFPNRHSGNLPLWAKEAIDKIVLPFEKDEEDWAYSVAMYRDLREMIPYRMAPDQQNSNESLNSFVMSMTLFPQREFLTEGVKITFKLFKKDVNHQPKCSYWNTSQDIGYWSTDGCVLVSYDADRGIAVCECNHLTNFAILMSQTTATAEHTKLLSILSLVGCIVSMVFLVATVAVHLKYWRHVEREQATVLLNLCISLFLGHMVFLAGVDKVTNKAVCTFVAVLLHFVYTVVFFTMLANGLLLAKVVLKPFNQTPIAIWSLLASYGGASIIVGISTAVTQLDGYGSSSSCWLSVGSRLIWTFIAPVLVVCVINTVILVIVLWKMYGTAVMSQKSIREKAAIGLRNISILLPTLGVTWVFGVFSVNEDTLVFQYLFCIFNSLQGLIIFIFHCIMNEKIKKAFLRSFKMDQSQDTTSSDKDKIKKTFLRSFKTDQSNVTTSSDKDKDGSKNEREMDNSNYTALANQKHINIDPVEAMMMNMGYRLTNADEEENVEPGGHEAQVT